MRQERTVQASIFDLFATHEIGDELKGQRSACASSRRVRNTGSAVASAHPIVSPARISWVKSSASGAMVTGVFTRRSERHLIGATDFLEPRGCIARKG
jgi:hypothetical protein